VAAVGAPITLFCFPPADTGCAGPACGGGPLTALRRLQGSCCPLVTRQQAPLWRITGLSAVREFMRSWRGWSAADGCLASAAEPRVVGRPELPFPDEPTSGLDPEARQAEHRRSLAGR
jgi:hypothetical protein